MRLKSCSRGPREGPNHFGCVPHGIAVLPEPAELGPARGPRLYHAFQHIFSHAHTFRAIPIIAYPAIFSPFPTDCGLIRPLPANTGEFPPLSAQFLAISGHCLPIQATFGHIVDIHDDLMHRRRSSSMQQTIVYTQDDHRRHRGRPSRLKSANSDTAIGTE